MPAGVAPLVLSVTLLVPAFVSPSAATEPGGAAVEAETGEHHRRLHLLFAETDHGYWGVDPDDPELDVSTFASRCPDAPWTLDSKPCRGAFADGVGGGYALDFIPGSLLHERPTWSPATPLRFRIAIDVESVRAFSVHLQFYAGGDAIHTSPAAAEVAPGIFEGTLGSGGSLDPDASNLFTVFVRSDDYPITVRFHGRGASFVEFPEPFAASSIPALRAQDTYRPEPTSLDTASHSVRFNDANWSSQAFDGLLGGNLTVAFSMPRPAAAVLAWIEVFDGPLTYHALRQREADPRRLRSAFEVRLSDAGGELAHGSSIGELGRITDSLAAIDVEAGPLQLEVESIGSQDPVPYRLFFLAIHGERTLRSFRVRFAAPTKDVSPHVRTPQAAVCQGGGPALPVPREATTVHADLDWDTPMPSVTRWTPAFYLEGVGSFPCGELGNGDWIRLTDPTPRTEYLGVAPAMSSPAVSYRDTVFEYEITYAYSPPS